MARRPRANRGRAVSRRDLLALLGATVLVWPPKASGQEPHRTYRIGALQVSSHDAPQHTAFYDELSRLGFVEGQNLQTDRQGYGLQSEKFAKHAAELVKTKVDVIVCGGATAIRAAQQATTMIPILGFTDDMVGQGLVRSMAHPGGNTTGISILAAELDGKRQELLLELVPSVRRIGALVDSFTMVPTKLQALRNAASAKGVELLTYSVGKPEEIAPAIDAAKASGISGLNVLASPILFANRQIIFARTAALDLPAIYEWPEMAKEGGFAGYGPSIVQLYRQQMSHFLVLLLRGSKPADLPVTQPTNFGLVINLKTAKALSIRVPPALLARADEVIE